MVEVKEDGPGLAEAGTRRTCRRARDIYVTRCMTCHGCAGNGLGSYGGHQVVTPVNYKAEPYRGNARRRMDLARLGGRPGHADAGLEGS